MAYSFQTFSVGDVLTAAKMNQVEVNIRDHGHGIASVSIPVTVSRSSDTVLAVADAGKLIVATATFTQTLTAAASLGNGWFVGYRVESGAVITINPDASETVDGSATKTLTGPTSGYIFCDGSNFKTVAFTPVVSGTLVKFTAITATDAAWAKQSTTTALVTCAVGGGGAGGGAVGDSVNYNMGGGGNAGTVVWGFVASGASATYAATIGAGGAGVSNADGNAGGTTSFGAVASAVGGLGGKKNASSSPTVALSSFNGEANKGIGGAGTTADANGGAAAANSGAGGGGGGSPAAASNRSGGSGGSGIIYVWEFS